MHTGDVLIPVQGSDDHSTVSKLLAVLGVWREEALEQSDGRIKHRSALATGLHSDMNLLKICELGRDPGDLSVVATSEVDITEESSQLVGLLLKDYIRGGNEKGCQEGVHTSPNGVLSVVP